jgi:hypothetical protein
MAVNFGGFEVDPETGNIRRAAGGRPPRKSRPRKSKIPGPLLSVIVTLLFGLLYYYFELPAFNIHSGDLYMFIIALCAVFVVCEILTTGFKGDTARSYLIHIRKKATVPFIIVCICLAVVIVGSVIGFKVFRARAYSSLLTVETGDFASGVAEISFDQIPMLDKTSANVLANRKLGELSDLVSQFEVYGDSYQINYKNKPVRVTYLYYGDFFKWLNNQKNGIPAYMIIDMVTQEVSVQRLDKGIRYSPSEYFFRDINRYLRINYPTKIFSDVNFEINDSGDPYWVATVITKKIGLFGGADVAGAVLVNAVTGECVYYDKADVPTWVDRVYSADLIIQQYDYYGLFKSGFLNSLFGQRGCTETTDGYNYIAQDDDVWVYTGITSVSSDQGNIGFILVNQRTKEARYYSCAGAEEYSAMSSAQGAVQQYEYSATFPLLLNISGQPTYFIALKDDSQLVKMYAMVNVQQYQIVATGTSAKNCADNYEQLLISSNIISGAPGQGGSPGGESVSGRIADIRTAVISGNTRYYIRLENSDVFYAISAAESPEVVILNVGDTVEITYEAAEGSIVDAASVTKK